MELQLKSQKVWLANEPVDFRKAINGLSELVRNNFKHCLAEGVFVFHNRAKNRLKLLAFHRNGVMLIYKHLDKKKFTVKQNEPEPYEITESQLSWLLAGLDWVEMSIFETLVYDDYF